jgi:serine/threonine protein kinase
MFRQRHSNFSTELGSDQYHAPEILRGRAYSGAVDVWAIGCLLYELFADYRTVDTRSEIGGYESGNMPECSFD